ncbi:hypothetical protein ACFXOI_19595 [Streptomyces bacillaris]|uniref:hypothetical protein n=1 Tax=Streptomyces bacillaris TaxID=68179 RepID=UPI003677B9E2
MTGSTTWTTPQDDAGPYPMGESTPEHQELVYLAAGPDWTQFQFKRPGLKYGIVRIHNDGTVDPFLPETPDWAFATRERVWVPPEPAGTELVPPGRPVIPTARAIAARHAAASGDHKVVTAFMTDVLGLWRGARWLEPVSTALLGDWAGELHTHGRVGFDGLARLEAEARELHRHLTPLWRRKVNGDRLRSLDFDLGSGLTVHDLVAGSPAPFEALFGALPDNPGVAAVLEHLTPTERAVAAAWANFRTTTWAEAACEAVAEVAASTAAANALGERVRRKLRRLGRQYAEGTLARTTRAEEVA